MTNIDLSIEEKIKRLLTGEATPADKADLDNWIASSPANMRHYQKNLRTLRKIKIGLTVIPAKEMAEEIAARLVKIKLRRRKKRYLRATSIAASLAILIGGYFLSQNDQPEASEEKPAITSISPGKAKAYLELESGERLDLTDTKENIYMPELSATLNLDSNALVYHQDTTAVSLHKLIVPRGGEYSLVLADGTRVRINSGSELRYPANFTEKHRKVFLSGEAYFEVSPQANKPFIVQTEDMEIRVLGTSFNVNAYPGKTLSQTTLEEGHVQIHLQNQTEDLSPGEQCSFNRTTQKLTVKQVDTELYTSWRKGYYNFKQTPLEEILNTLSLWYNVNIEYEHEALKHLNFTGKLQRFEDIRHLLRKFELTGDVTFVVQGNTIQAKTTKKRHLDVGKQS